MASRGGLRCRNAKYMIKLTFTFADFYVVFHFCTPAQEHRASSSLVSGLSTGVSPSVSVGFPIAMALGLALVRRDPPHLPILSWRSQGERQIRPAGH
jgi:hypothetical protein